MISDTEARKRIQHAVGQLDQTVMEIRTSIFDLHTADETESLRRTLLDVVSELTNGTDVSPTVRMSGAVDTLVPPEIAPHAEAALREGLSNALRHARAKHIVVTIEAAHDLIVDVLDDGVGVPETLARSGLANIENRASTFGGTLFVSGTPTGPLSLTEPSAGKLTVSDNGHNLGTYAVTGNLLLNQVGTGVQVTEHIVNGTNCSDATLLLSLDGSGNLVYHFDDVGDGTGDGLLTRQR